MEKIFNDFSVVGAFIGGILSFIFGKPDVLIYALLGLTIIDFYNWTNKGCLYKNSFK